MQTIPLLHRSTLLAATAILEEIGVSAQTHLNQHSLPKHADEPATYVPTYSALAFCETGSESAGIRDLGFRIADRAGVSGGSRWGPRVATAVTLLDAIRITRNSLKIDMPNVQLGLEDRGDGLWFWRNHWPAQHGIAGTYFSEQYFLGLMVQIVRMAEGPDWVPKRLRVLGPLREWAFELPAFASEGKIEFDARHTGIEIPKESLGRRIGRTTSGPVITQVPSIGEESGPPQGFVDSLHHVLMGIARSQPISLRLGAELTRCSPRSLQRTLATAGTTWREVVQRVHLETTLDLMGERTNSLADIAATLGYSQYPHFFRAFQRWTGESPSAYMKRLAS